MPYIDKQQLENYLLKHPEEAATIAAVKNFLAKKKLNISLRDKITGSAWIFNPNNGKVLLTQHKKLKRWVQLGGHYETVDSENIQKTALREAIEESGIESLTNHSSEIFNINIYLSSCKKNPYYLYDFCFLLHTEKNELLTSTESLNLRWVSMGEISASKQFKSIKNIATKWQLFCFEHAQIDE